MKPRAITFLSVLALLVSLSVLSGTAHANSTVGAWSLGPVWDIAPINMLVLPNGKVMFYPGNTINGDDPRMWDPATNTLTPLAQAGYDLFCTGHSFLKDGTILFTGGNLLTPFYGLPDASIYNPVTNVWTRLPDMNDARWYPSTTTLANGDVLVMTGTIDTTQMENPLPQIWQTASGTWRNLTNAMLKIYTYSWVYATPSGKAFVAGPEPTTRYLDTSGTGAWSTVGTTTFNNYRDYGSSVMYGPTNILIAGGGQPPTNTAEIINLGDTTPTWQATNSMAFARRHMNMTLLPDDNVLVTGGTSADGFNNQTQPVYAAEMWNIATRTWTTMASQTQGRFYHSNSLLLPDGRVLSAGGDGVFQAEIYSPPYLFKGARPTITSAPTHAQYGETFFVGTPEATNIVKARLIRLPAVTHAFDMNQRLIQVNFTQAGGGLNLTAPSSANFAPPGHYMLFILNSTGVPSVAKIIQIDGDPSTPTVPAAPSGLGATAASSSAINLTWADQATNEDGYKIERKTGAGSFTQIGTVGPNVTTYPDSGLVASTIYSYQVRAYNTVGNSGYSNTATATTLATPTVPAAPSGLGATAASSSAINLTWADQATNEDGYKIERKTGAGSFTQIGTVGPNVTTYPDSGLAASTSYSYQVRAYNTVGDSVYSNTATATTQAAGTTPATPTGLVATAASGSAITLTWVDQSSNETSFKIERALGGGAFSQVGTVGANVTTYADSGLAANTPYSYRIRASNTGGDSAFSNTVNATTFDGLVNVAASTLHGGVGYTVNQNFGTPGDTGAAPTQSVLRIFENGTELGPPHSYIGDIDTLGLGRFVHWGGNLFFSASNNTNPKTNGRTYAYRIGFPTLPATPSGLGATAASSTAINLTWVDQSTNETSFKIERALGAGAFSQVATVGANVTTYADSGLTAGTSYSYRVRASNTGGDSTYSNTASATTGAALPGAPSGLAATAASSTAINLTWVDQSTNETSFKIERALGAGAFSQVATVGANVTTYADSGLTAGTSYSYRVRASNTGGDSTYSNTASATTGAALPAAPSGLAATATFSTMMSLTWTDQSTNETSFKIERAQGAGAFSQVATVGADVTSFTDTGLSAATSYSYRIRASNSGGDSAYSNTATASTLPTAPAPPSGLGATAASSSAINLSWTDAATNEDGFKIERKTGAGAFAQIATVGPNVTTYADSGLTASTAYSYQVRANNTGGDSAYSNTASATTLAAPPPIPAPPTGLGATAASSSAINLSWTDAATNEDGFKIERKTGAGAFAQIATVGPNVTTYADSGLTASTAYSYQVRANNTGGDSAYSNTASATTLAAPPPIPAPPTGLGATAASSSAINLSWTDAATNEDGFKIERKTGAGAFAQIATVGPNVTTYADSGLTASTAYSYQVRANNTGGDSAYSNTATATTLPPSPAAPSGLAATAASSTSINLSWVDQSTNETSFKIERAQGAGAFSQVATVGADVTTFIDIGLSAATSYSYRIRASNTGGDSTYSNTASATTGAALPAAPSGLAATATFSTMMSLTWTDQSTNETSFKIERAQGAGAFSQVATVGADVTSFTDTGLSAATSYSYRIRASNSGGDSAYSNTATASTLPTAPAPPSGLGATAASSSAINLSWTDAATNEDGFKIERKTGAGAFAQIATVGPNVTTYADSGLTASTAYSYQVRANNTGGDSAYSNTASATTLAAPPPIPAPPTGLGATAASSSAINLSWTDAATNEDGFKIERKTGAGAFAQIATVGPNVTTYADSGLTASTAYSYQVRANNTGGDSAYSNTATASTLPTAPAPPSGLGATAASSSAINLSWTDAATNEDGFKIERKTGAGAFAQIATVGPNVTTYADSGLTASTAYSYQVRANNTGGDSAYSNTASATTLAAPPPIPAPPTGLGATAASSSAINLSWTDAATNEDGFKIERKTGAGAFAQIATVGPNVTTYADSGLTASTAYSYQVRANNTGGDSAYSNTATASTLPTAPAPPSGLGATAASSSAINLSWTDAATNEDGFKIERKTGAGAFAQIATVGPNVTTYADSGLTASTAYSYQVRANNTGGDSAYSNTASATTLPPAPAPPTGLGATAVSSSAINLSWTDAATNETGFKIERKTGAGAFAQIATVGPNVTTYADSGLTASTAYSYQVRANNTGGDSAYSNTASATTLPPAPAPPTGLGATAVSSSAINLSWTDAATNETGFKIERKTGAGAFAQIATVGPNVTTYADSGLTASTAYSYQVRANNTGGDSAYSNTASATTLPPAPAPPTGLGATAVSSSAINLSWTDAATNETGFKIERKTGAGAFAQIATVGPNVTTYADSGLTASTAYSYQVRANNTGGDSAYSNTASATTQAAATAPAAPTGLGSTASSSSAITLTWVDQANNETGFKIERKTGAGSFAQIATVAANITTYANSGLASATNYSYRVRANNAVGDSAYSNTASATTSGVINVAAATLHGGVGYAVNQNFGTPGDTSAAPTQSVLRIFENGIELGPAHSYIGDIDTIGLGRFVHWGGNLFFTASNNTNPKTNGRTYTYRIGTTP